MNNSIENHVITLKEIKNLLTSGLQTKANLRAIDSNMINKVVNELQQVPNDDIENKLIIAGFTDYTVTTDDIEQSCETCMYYKVHQQFCDLPELMFPVLPHWSCRLWRI